MAARPRRARIKSPQLVRTREKLRCTVSPEPRQWRGRLEPIGCLVFRGFCAGLGVESNPHDSDALDETEP